MKTKSSPYSWNKCCVIVPAFNEAEVIKETIKSLEPIGSKIICINDGSSDSTGEKISQTSAILLEHPFNLGQGASIQTGIDYALLDKNIEYFVTFDGDGQHNVKDVLVMLDYIKLHNIDVVLGSRFFGNQSDHIPLIKRNLLKFATAYSNLAGNIKLSDTHNGLRVFNRRFAQNLNIELAGMAHASEIIKKISANGYSFAELPVSISYSNYAKSKGQPIINSFNIVLDLMFEKLISK